jgi:hypothetical protein
LSNIDFASPVKTPTKNGEMARYGDDSALYVEFIMEPVYQEFESKKLGRQIYKDVEFIHIHTPGAKTDIKRLVKYTDQEAAPHPPETASGNRRLAG